MYLPSFLTMSASSTPATWLLVVECSGVAVAWPAGAGLAASDLVVIPSSANLYWDFCPFLNAARN